MCIAPITLPNGMKTSCHDCWQCQERRINDWVGRCIAETKTAGQTFAVTLTYGRNRVGDVDHPHSALLTYSDVQKYLKKLRFHRHSVRYLVAGEYGEQKGRAHWHLILFFKNTVPKHVLDKNFMCDHWEHGFSHWSKPEHAAIRYVCKYVFKDSKDPTKQGMLAMSKKPPLGLAYFEELARRHVVAGLSPQSLLYRFPEVTSLRKNGGIKTQQVIDFYLKDRMAELYCESFIRQWREAHGNNHWPNSDLIDNFYDYGRIVNDPDRIEPLDIAGLRKIEGKHEVTPEQRAAARRRRLPPDPMTGWPYNDPEWVQGYIDGEQDRQHERRETREEYTQRVAREQDEFFARAQQAGDARSKGTD